jgi:predicted CoA-binding protein
LSQKRLAFVGVSQDPDDFSRALFRELQDQGYQVIPVNPNATEIEEQPCFASVKDITVLVDGALLMTAPNVTDQVVRECAEADIRRVWMHRGVGRGSISEEAIEFCQLHGINVVPGFCPFMFLPKSGFIHRTHAFFMKLSGAYPA